MGIMFNLVKIYENNGVKRENSQPITSWHIILPSPQNIANNKAPRTATKFCYHYSETSRKLPSVIKIEA